jgi:hypothetical protein
MPKRGLAEKAWAASFAPWRRGSLQIVCGRTMLLHSFRAVDRFFCLPIERMFERAATA